MKRSFIAFLCLLLWSAKSVANVGSLLNLAIHVTGSDIPTESVEYLKNKIAVILSENNFNSALNSDRFFIVAKPAIISKSITNGEPSMVSNKVSITFRIADVIDNRVFLTFTQTYHGVGQSEQKAWINALTKVKNTPQIANQLTTVKSEITAFYNRQSIELIGIALSQAQENEYEAALATLAVIPNSVKNYDSVRKAIVEIYQSKCAHQNAQALLTAKNSWATSPNQEGALMVCSELSKIVSPSSEVLQQMDDLYSQIGRSIEVQNTREFELMRQKLANEHELALHEADNETSLWSTAIQLGYDFLSRQIQPINILSSIFTW